VWREFDSNDSSIGTTNGTSQRDRIESLGRECPGGDRPHKHPPKLYCLRFAARDIMWTHRTILSGGSWSDGMRPILS
jgi:hypothetical protein